MSGLGAVHALDGFVFDGEDDAGRSGVLHHAVAKEVEDLFAVDCIEVRQVAEGLADPTRLIVQGGSGPG
jgi:hypothetical protein